MEEPVGDVFPRFGVSFVLLGEALGVFDVPCAAVVGSEDEFEPFAFVGDALRPMRVEPLEEADGSAHVVLRVARIFDSVRLRRAGHELQQTRRPSP